LDPGGLLQHLHLDPTYQRFVHVDPKVRQECDDLLRAGLHSEARQGILDRPLLAGAVSSSFSHRKIASYPRVGLGLSFPLDHRLQRLPVLQAGQDLAADHEHGTPAQADHHAFTVCNSANSFIRACGSTGLTMWWSNPASWERPASSSCPQPVTAMRTIAWPHTCSLIHWQAW